MKRNSGFSLIELTVVMVIIGLLMGGFFSYLNVHMEKKKIDETVARQENNTTTLEKFTSRELTNNAGELVDRDGTVLATGATPVREERLPCPANPNLTMGQPGFGIEQCPAMDAADGSEFNGVRVAVTATGERVFIGAFPVTTLQTQGENAFDGYNSPYLYAVTARLTETTTAPMSDINTPGFITVQTSDVPSPDTTFTDKPFVLISTGVNGFDVNAGDVDFENLDGDAVFAAYDLRSENEDSYYDDRVSFNFTSNTSDENCEPTKLDIQEFRTDGTWTKPDGFKYAEVEVWGAGGGGSGDADRGEGTRSGGKDGDGSDVTCHTNPVCTGARGGHGGYAKKLFSQGAVSDDVMVTIGSGGLGRVIRSQRESSSIAATSATATSFGSYITLTGGGAATASGSYVVGATETAGTNGSITGADYITFSGSYVTVYGGSTGGAALSSVPPVILGGNCGQCVYNGGNGANGVVVVTSYICD